MTSWTKPLRYRVSAVQKKDFNHVPHTQEDPSQETVRVVPVRAEDITEGKEIKLLLATTASCVDGKKNWPRNDGANQADEDKNLEKPHEQVVVQGIVVEDITIG